MTLEELGGVTEAARVGGGVAGIGGGPSLVGPAAPLIASYGTPDEHPQPAFGTFGTVDKKNALRAGALAAGTTLMMLLMSSPALAVTRDDGDDPGSGLSVIETLGLFVVAPLVLFGVIAGLVMVLDKSHESHRVTTRNIKTKPKAESKV
ncbi:hypothetical protein SALBM311S_04020 [Streptomyces alboniger]